MRKKILATILVAGLLAAQTLTAFAAGSKTTDGVSVSDGYVVSDAPSYDGQEQNLSTLVAGSGSAVEDLVKGKTALSKVFDVSAITGTAAPYTITFTKDTIKAGVSDVAVLHYNGSASAWEDVTVAGSVDLTAHQVKGYFTSLSPVIIIGKVAATPAQKPSSGSHRTYPDEDTNNGGGAAAPAADATGAAVSPKTGVTSTWGVWAVAGLAFAVAACVVARRKRA